MNGVSSETIFRWSELSPAQQTAGIYLPNDSRLEFDELPNSLSEDQLAQIRRFFLGCELARSQVDRNRGCLPVAIENSHPFSGVIEELARKGLPESFKEDFIKEDQLPPTIGRDAATLVRIFNQIIEDHQSGLMHPGRHRELQSYVGQLDSSIVDLGLVANRLIEVRFFGYYRAQVCELERAISKDEKEGGKLGEQTRLSKKHQEVIRKSVGDFERGDFSFLIDPHVGSAISEAFAIVEGLGKWKVFDIEPPESKGYMWSRNEEIQQITQRLETSHTGWSQALVLRNLQLIHQKGWEFVVQTALNKELGRAGALDRAELVS